MTPAFVIMQIGDSGLDKLFDEAIRPALRNCGLDAKRVDKHNEGRLLKSEIIRLINSAEIIVADLTNERPHCYLEVGYAMGAQKFERLILTARDDHAIDNPKRHAGGPKVHFDLSGYDILFWNSADIPKFQSELERRVRRRLAIVPPAGNRISPLDSEWFRKHREAAARGLKAARLAGMLEISFTLPDATVSKNSRELLVAAEAAEVKTFGWPIGIVLPREGMRPRPAADGIVAEVSLPDNRSYDYWALRQNGDGYLAASFFEDETDKSKVYFNTQIIRVTEAFLYSGRLFAALGVPRDATIALRISHVGIQGRVLSVAPGTPVFWRDRGQSREATMTAEITVTIGELETDLVVLVKKVLAPLFALFDFFELPDERYQAIVQSFVQGRPI